jgi:hypothetical protein
VIDELLAAFQDAVAALPDDLPAEDLDDVLRLLVETVTTRFVGLLDPLVRAGNALAELSRADLVCTGTFGSPPAEGDSDDGGPDGDGTDTRAQPPQGAARAAAIAGTIDGLLSTLPEPLDVPALLQWVLDRVGGPQQLPPPIPSITDLVEPLVIVLTLGDAPAETVREHLAETLSAMGDLVATIPGEVAAVAEDLDAAAAAVPDDLPTLAADVAARLHDLAAAAEAGDATAAQAATDALESLADTFDALLPSLRGALLDDAATRVAAVADLAETLDDRAALVAQALTPADLIGPLVARLQEQLSGEATADAIAAAVTEIDGFAAWLQDLLRALDLASLAAPLDQASAVVTDAVDEVQQVLANVGAGVAGALATVAALLEAVDPAALVAGARTQFEEFLDDLEIAATAAFAPVQSALTAVTDAVVSAADTFDPASLTGVVDDAVAAVTAVLEDPAVTAAVSAAGGALQSATAQLEQVQFTPVTTQVIAAIEEVDELLAGLDTSVLPAPAVLALKAALTLLPGELTPITDALRVELQALIDAGPVELLELVRAAPAALRARIEEFDPATLIGDQLGPVFDEVRASVEGLSPAAVLAPVTQAAAELPATLGAAIDVAALLAPLDAPVTSLRAALEGFDAAALAVPLTAGLADVVTTVRDTLGIAALEDALAGVHERITDTVAMLGTLRDATDGVATALQRVADLDASIDAWASGRFTQAITDDGTIAAAAAALAAAVQAAGQPALLPAAQAAPAQLTSRIDEVDPAARLAALVTAHRAVDADEVGALPQPTRGAALAVLQRLDPFDGALAGCVSDLAMFAEDLTEATAATVDALADWDARHLAASGPLVQATTFDAAPAALLTQMRTAAGTSVVEPLRAVVGVAGPVVALMTALLQPLRALLTDVEARVASLASVTGALGGVATAVDDALGMLATPDLGVLEAALDDAVERVTVALDTITPSAIGAELDAALQQILNTLDPAALLPGVTALQNAFDDALAALLALDPAIVLGGPLGDAFSEQVVPLLDQLDMTPLLDAVTLRLAALPEELDAELAKVNSAYQRLLEHAQDLQLSIQIDVDIDVTIPSPF